MEEKRGVLRRIGPTQVLTGRRNCSPSFRPFATRTYSADVNFFRVACEGEMAPTKRTWDEANAGPELDAASSLQGSNGGTAGSRHGPQQSRPLQNQGAARDAPSTSPTAATSASTSQHIPMISRKIRACASCRKHKVMFFHTPFQCQIGPHELLSMLLCRSSALWTRILGHPARDAPRRTLYVPGASFRV